MAGLAEEIDSTQDVSNRKGGKYLTFSIGDEEYGISILKIKHLF